MTTALGIGELTEKRHITLDRRVTCEVDDCEVRHFSNFLLRMDNKKQPAVANCSENSSHEQDGATHADSVTNNR